MDKDKIHNEDLEVTIPHLIIISIVTLAFVRAMRKRSIPVVKNYYIIPGDITPIRYI